MVNKTTLEKDKTSVKDATDYVTIRESSISNKRVSGDPTRHFTVLLNSRIFL